MVAQIRYQEDCNQGRSVSWCCLCWGGSDFKLKTAAESLMKYSSKRTTNWSPPFFLIFTCGWTCWIQGQEHQIYTAILWIFGKGSYVKYLHWKRYLRWKISWRRYTASPNLYTYGEITSRYLIWMVLGDWYSALWSLEQQQMESPMWSWCHQESCWALSIIGRRRYLTNSFSS